MEIVGWVMRFYGLTEERSKEMSGLKNLGPLQPIGVLLGYTGPPEESENGPIH